MMLIAFIAYFLISLPVGYFCGFVLEWGIIGVWMAFPFGLTSAGPVSYTHLCASTSWSSSAYLLLNIWVVLIDNLQVDII